MKVLLCIAVVFVAGARADPRSDCDMGTFYGELGCTPIPSNFTGCPIAYSCPDLHPDPKMCYYKGKPYSDRSRIPRELIKNPCSVDCLCEVSEEGARFNCAAIDCVESFDNDMRQECILTYNDVMECCSSGSVCGKDAVAALATCVVDGGSYKEGQIFEQDGKVCLCTAQWNATDPGSSCRDLDCGTEIRRQQELLDNCAPVYFKTSKASCPIDFVCPSPTIKATPSSISPPSEQCLFGDQRLSLGDELEVTTKCTKCSCEVPPFVTCIYSTCT